MPSGSPAARIACEHAGGVIGKRVEDGSDEHVARHTADGIEMDMHYDYDSRKIRAVPRSA